MAVLHFGVAIVVSAHAILYKRDVRAAIGWTGLIWLAPFAGSLLYWLLGINRIRRRAVRLEHPALVVRESTRVYTAGAAGSRARLACSRWWSWRRAPPATRSSPATG